MGLCAAQDAPEQLVAGQHGLVEVGLPVHEPAGDEEVLDGVDALRLDHDLRVGPAREGMHAHGLEQALDPHLPLRHAGVEGVAPEVVEPIHVELARDQLVEEGAVVRVVEHGEGQVERTVHALVEVGQEDPAHVLVRKVLDELVFEGVGEGAVPHVVQQGHGQGGGLLLRAHGRALLGQVGEGVLHEGHRPQCMVEAGVLGARKDEVPDAELTDPAQPLDLRRLDEVHDHVLRHRDEPVHRVREELKALVGRHEERTNRCGRASQKGWTAGGRAVRFSYHPSSAKFWTMEV